MTAENKESLPATLDITEADLAQAGLPRGIKMSPGLAIFMNPKMYEHTKRIAVQLSQADGIVGKHLIGKPSACLAIVSRSITWNLDPFAVAQSTYETPGGKVGYEGKLVQAILENCGALDGRVHFQLVGDWAKLRGRFKMIEGTRGSRYPAPDWKDEDEIGLGIVVRAQVKNESTPREEEFFLREMWPRNSTLWATRPSQQMKYASVRAFANVAAPGLLMGIPFDVDPTDFYTGEPMTELNPRPSRRASSEDNAFDRARTAATDKPAEGQTVEQPAQEAQEGAGAASEAGAAKATDPDVEPALVRGKRLLDGIKTIGEVADLRLSIAEELMEPGDDQAIEEWDKACDERSRQLTGGKAKAKAGQ